MPKSPKRSRPATAESETKPPLKKTSRRPLYKRIFRKGEPQADLDEVDAESTHRRGRCLRCLRPTPSPSPPNSAEKKGLLPTDMASASGKADAFPPLESSRLEAPLKRKRKTWRMERAVERDRIEKEESMKRVAVTVAPTGKVEDASDLALADKADVIPPLERRRRRIRWCRCLSPTLSPSPPPTLPSSTEMPPREADVAPTEEEEEEEDASDKVQPDESGSAEYASEKTDVIYRDERKEKKRRKFLAMKRKEKMLKALEKIKRMRRMRRRKLKREALPTKKKERGIKYPGIWIPPKGFTLAEYQICRPFMSWRTFETELFIPKEHKTLKVFYDQVRKTRGYGVTVPHPNPGVGRQFIPLGEGMERAPRIKSYMPGMIEVLVDEMQTELKLRPVDMQLTNVVSVPEYLTYLISHSFKPQNITLRRKPSEGDKEEEVEVDTVEAMFYVEPGVTEDYTLKEWKLKRGLQLVYSSKSTKEAMKYFKNWWSTYVSKVF